MDAVAQLPPLNAIVLTVPLTFGFHEVTVNGAVARKLKMLFRVNEPLDPLILVKVPTAYMVPPQCAIWRIVSVVLVASSVGVPASGLGDTLPAWASAGTAGAHSAPAVIPAISARLTLRPAHGRA